MFFLLIKYGNNIKTLQWVKKGQNAIYLVKIGSVLKDATTVLKLEIRIFAVLMLLDKKAIFSKCTLNSRANMNFPDPETCSNNNIMVKKIAPRGKAKPPLAHRLFHTNKKNICCHNGVYISG